MRLLLAFMLLLPLNGQAENLWGNQTCGDYVKILAAMKTNPDQRTADQELIARLALGHDCPEAKIIGFEQCEKRIREEFSLGCANFQGTAGAER